MSNKKLSDEQLKGVSGGEDTNTKSEFKKFHCNSCNKDFYATHEISCPICKSIMDEVEFDVNDLLKK